VEIGLRTAEIPFRVARYVRNSARLSAGAGTGRSATSAAAKSARSARGTGTATPLAGGPRRLNEAAILNPTVDAGAFALEFGLQLEVTGLPALPDEVDRAGGFFAGGFDGDHAVIDVPEIGVAVPTLETRSVEHR